MLHIVIDGYNFLHASRDTDHDWTQLSLEDARNAILSFLVTRRRPSHERITIVFDGAAAGPPEARKSKLHGLEIVFSEPGVTADEVIKEMLRSAPNPRGILIVTADNAIRDVARMLGAKIVSPRNFILRAEEEQEKRLKAPPREPREKYIGTDKGQVDAWRRIFGFDKEPGGEREPDENAGGPDDVKPPGKGPGGGPTKGPKGRGR